jgi:hypothetical protein
MSDTPWWWSPWPTRPEHTVLAARIAALDERVTMAQAEHQDQINALSTRLDAVAGGLRSDIDELKAAVARGETLDFTPVEAKLTALEGLDAENPEATPVTDLDPNAPAEPAAPGDQPAPAGPGQ